MATEYCLVPCCQLNIISHLVSLLFLRSLFLVFKSLIFNIPSINCKPWIILEAVTLAIMYVITVHITHQRSFACSLSSLSGRTSQFHTRKQSNHFSMRIKQQCAFNRKCHIFQMTRNFCYLNTVLI